MRKTIKFCETALTHLLGYSNNYVGCLALLHSQLQPYMDES